MDGISKQIYSITQVIGFRFTRKQRMHIFHSVGSIPARPHFTDVHIKLQLTLGGERQYR